MLTARLHSGKVNPIADAFVLLSRFCNTNIPWCSVTKIRSICRIYCYYFIFSNSYIGNRLRRYDFSFDIPVKTLATLEIRTHQKCHIFPEFIWDVKLQRPLLSHSKRSGPWFNIKMSSYQYRKSHCGDKTILRPSYLHNGISYTGKTTSLYWIGTLHLCNLWQTFMISCRWS